jgi:hypothetical protein
MKRVRCQNAFVSEAVRRGMTITVRLRLAGSGYMEKTARIDFANQLVSLHAGWGLGDSKHGQCGMEDLPYDGEWFRQKNLREEKQTWDAGFNAAVRSGRQNAFLFIGNWRVNRFTGEYEQEVAERADVWHWENICDAFSTLRVFIKDNPPPVWPKSSRKKGLYDEVNKQSALWLARRAVFFRKNIHPKLLGSLGYFADRYGDVPSFLVVGGPCDVSEYVRKQQRRLNHHCRKESTRAELMNEIQRGEWPSVARRIGATHVWKSAITKAIRRAVKAGVASTAGARRWFQKFHAISLLGGWARREEEARKQSTNKEAIS